jgi:two-component system, NtrC family, response regulator HydG
MDKVLVVDDDNDMCLLLVRFLTRNGFDASSANSGKAALDAVRKNTPDLILLDFKLDDMTGAELLQKVKQNHPTMPVIVITGYSDVKSAVEVMKSGAFDYVTKPLYPDEILLTIKNALSPEPHAIDNAKKQEVGLKAPPAQRSAIDDNYIIGDAPEVAQIMKQIDLVAPTNFSVIIYGESGSGKEVIARQIHLKSRRADKPFIAIDCGALSKELAASELFGHEKGAFTGALTQKLGSLELANGGTIFLDEISNLSYEIQVSLLRVVQERKIRRVGGVKDIDLDLRIVVAGNERLWDAARAGRFREDLYHRFNEFSIEVPPLRDRKSDIMLFSKHFLKMTNSELGKNVKGFTKEVEDIFKSYVWYGNLRELKNVVKRAVLLTDGEWVEAKTLPFEISNYSKLSFDKPNANTTTVPVPSSPKEQPENLELKFRTANVDAEYLVILDALKQADFNKSKAASLLNIDRKTLYNKMKLYKEFNTGK